MRPSIPWDTHGSLQPQAEEFFQIGHIPAVLYGAPSEAVWLFLHGQMGHKEEAKAFAQVVCPKGAQVPAVDLPGHGTRQGQGETLDPQTAVPELRAVMDWAKTRWRSVSLRANSIGAYFATLSFDAPAKALLVSPIPDMEGLILDRMAQAKVTTSELRARGEFHVPFGPPLSWDYLCYVRDHPVHPWQCPVSILYGGQDNMTARRAMEEYASRRGAQLTIMENGEHWFHTPEQLAFLQAWEEANT